jgi:signal peptidase II
VTETEPIKVDHKRTILDYLYLVLVSGSLIGLDQWTKSLVRVNIPVGGEWYPEWLSWLAPFARVRHWHNSGAAFGVFQNGNLIFSIFAVLVAIGIIYYFPRAERKYWWLRLALALQLAGALGNLIDRLQFGRVTDFISVGDFAIFNVADASISVGVAMLAIGVLWLEYKQKKQVQETKDGE